MPTSFLSSSAPGRCVAGAVFEPEVTIVMSVVFDEICEQLLIPMTAESIRQIIAIRILELAHNGEHDPMRLRDAVLESIGVARVGGR
jgi:hypothetical protein